ncbi:MAG: hypothetical protein KBA07_06320 [Petrotogaceae bacterium]|jgi:hypothetical protein|nr:hypothetical protein [Petrotogaceae bacterium]
MNILNTFLTQSSNASQLTELAAKNGKITGKVIYSDGEINLVSINGKLYILNSEDGKKLPEGSLVNIVFSKNTIPSTDQNIIKSYITKALGEISGNIIKFSLGSAQESSQTIFSNIKIDFSQIPDTQKGKFLVWVSDLFDSLNTSMQNDKVFSSFLENFSRKEAFSSFIKSIISELSKDFFSNKIFTADPRFISDKTIMLFKDSYFNLRRPEGQKSTDLFNTSNIDKKKSLPVQSDSENENKLVDKNSLSKKESYQEIFSEKKFDSLKEPTSDKKQTHKIENQEKSLLTQKESLSLSKDEKIKLQDSLQVARNSYKSDPHKETETSYQKRNSDFQLAKNTFKKESFDESVVQRTTNELKKELILDYFKNHYSAAKKKVSEAVVFQKAKESSEVPAEKNQVGLYFKKAESSQPISQKIDLTSFKFYKSILRDIFDSGNNIRTVFVYKEKNDAISNFLLKENTFEKNITEQISKQNPISEKLSQNTSKPSFEKASPFTIETRKQADTFEGSPVKNPFNIQQKKYIDVSQQTNQNTEPKSNLLHATVLGKVKISDSFRNEILTEIPSKKQISEKLSFENNSLFSKSSISNAVEKAVSAYKVFENTKTTEASTYFLVSFLGMPVFFNFRRLSDEFGNEKNSAEKNYGKLRMVMPTETFGMADITLFMSKNDVIIKLGIDRNFKYMQSNSISLNQALENIGYNLVLFDIFINPQNPDISRDTLI